MAFNIDRFKESVSRHNGVSRVNKFEVIFPQLPAGIADLGVEFQKFAQDEQRDLSLWCESATIPGLNINVRDDIQRYGYGPRIQKPVGVIFPDIQLSFIGDNKGSVLYFFNQWMKLITDYNFSKGIYAYSVAGMHTFDINYFSDYVVDFDIVQYDDVGDASSRSVVNASGSNQTTGVTKWVKVLGAFPKSVTDLQLDWNSTNQPSKINVTFAMFSWHDWTDQAIACGAAERGVEAPVPKPKQPSAYLGEIDSTDTTPPVTPT